MSISPYAAATAAAAATAVVGGLGTDTGSAWYRSLDIPSWQPPGSVIGGVWTTLYGLIGWSAGRAWRRARPERRSRLALLLGANLAINAAWPWVFFRAHRPAAGVAVIAALEASTIALTAEVKRADRAAAVALAPYLSWNAFALVLDAVIVRRNRVGGH